MLPRKTLLEHAIEFLIIIMLWFAKYRSFIVETFSKLSNMSPQRKECFTRSLTYVSMKAFKAGKRSYCSFKE